MIDNTPLEAIAVALIVTIGLGYLGWVLIGDLTDWATEKGDN